eukprot:4566844-Amphidinium_carterae.2
MAVKALESLSSWGSNQSEGVVMCLKALCLARLDEDMRFSKRTSTIYNSGEVAFVCISPLELLACNLCQPKFSKVSPFIYDETI